MFDRLPIRRRVVAVLLPVLLALMVGIGVFLATRNDAGSMDPTPGPTAPAPDSEEEGAAGAAGGGGEDSADLPSTARREGSSEESPTTPPAGRAAARRAEGVKTSGALYRAVGKPDFRPSVISPPQP